ncbi:MAG: nitroreductase, partial [Microbacteriaceae bacterium]
LLAIVAIQRPSDTVAGWEQEAVASGVAHLLSLLLHDAGWGVMWRTGDCVRTKPVHTMHELRTNEFLLGWLYVGGLPAGSRDGRRKPVDAAHFLTELN